MAHGVLVLKSASIDITLDRVAIDAVKMVESTYRVEPSSRDHRKISDHCIVLIVICCGMFKNRLSIGDRFFFFTSKITSVKIRSPPPPFRHEIASSSRQ